VTLILSPSPNGHSLLRRLKPGQKPKLPTGPLSYVASRRLGESPPPAPRACFGRGELIEKIIGLAANLTPIALIGAGGIGKTSIALTVLHHGRIKQRFGDNRRFIRCDRFPASHTHLLSRLSKVIGAGIGNPEDLASLRPFLSSKEVLIILDNAESVLDPRGADAREIYAIVEELSQLDNVCLCITSRISTIPPDCETINVPTLSIDAARDTFYRIYKSGERSDLVDNILDELDFHPLSITLLATVAHQSIWDPDRLVREWERRRTSMLQTEHNNSLAAAIEVSLTSPLFQELGPDARGLLEVVAFFPQGVDEKNLDWLFPSIPNRTDIFDKFCILSLTYRSNGFATMLAPLRDYLSPKDPGSSALLCTTKEHYFSRMSVDIDPIKSNFRESQWIVSEDVNVEHLLDIFTVVDADSDSVWDACGYFMRHLYWHKNRLVILKLRIEGLPDDHRCKPLCLSDLSWLFNSVGDRVEQRRLLSHALKLQRERGGDYQIAIFLKELSGVNRLMGLHKEGIEAIKEALGIFKRLGETVHQATCLIQFALLFCDDEQFDVAEGAALRAIGILPEKGEDYQVCESHSALGEIYQSKGEIEKAIRHYELALGIASSFNWDAELFWVHYELLKLFRREGRFDDAQTHVEHAKSHAVNSAYNLGYVTEQQAWVWYEQDRLEEAKSEALCAAGIYEKLGAAKDVEDCKDLLRHVEEKLNVPVSSGQPEPNCEFLQTALSLASIKIPSQAQGTE